LGARAAAASRQAKKKEKKKAKKTSDLMGSSSRLRFNLVGSKHSHHSLSYTSMREV
jgi:hypothetical protein